MLLPRTKLLTLISILVPVFAQAQTTFRTPAKRYGSAYSIKLTLKKGATDYVVSTWVKPDQAESTLDHHQMKDLGWAEPLNPKKPILSFDDVSLSGTAIDKVSFKNQKTDWAFAPDFPRGCCQGVIGRDILSQYKIKFVPRNPTALEWTKIETDDVPKLKTAWIASLAALFSVRSEVTTFQKKKIDLSDNGYTLDISKGTIEFEPTPLAPGEKGLNPRATPLFSFYFMPPLRKLQIEGIASDVRNSAKKAKISVGSIINRINGQSIFLLSQFEVEAFFKGKRSSKLELRLDKREQPVVFDFEKGAFIP